ncbi:MAG: hypothetical protein WC197_08955 [Candidatus Gastranaerophilaceae bacterium]|jgi:hypothetical protein
MSVKQVKSFKLKKVLQSHENASINHIEFGIRTLELCNKACDLYLVGTVEEKREILKNLLSNSFLQDGKLNYEYKKPFNIFAEGLNRIKKLPLLDNTRTFEFGNIDMNMTKELLKSERCNAL